MTFQMSCIDAIPVVSMEGELSRKNARWLDDIIYSSLSSGKLKMVLDLSGLKHIDYKLVEHLSKRIEEIRNVGGMIAFAAATAYIKNIFEAMGCVEGQYPTVSDALLGLADDVHPEQWQ